MNILIVHNKYNSKGGEDITVEKEIKLLEKNGHKVDFFTKSNSQIKSIFSKIKTAINSSFSYETYNYFNNTSFLQKYDIIHVHNFFPLITPSIFYAAKNNNIPIVMTLHNYRLICPSGLLMHKNKIYEKSIKYSPYSTVIDRVYKNSFIGTFFLVLTIGLTGDPIAIGTMLMVMVYMGGHISGAHYNPAVSIAMIIRGLLSVKEAIKYIFSQLGGALLASYLVSFLTGDIMKVAAGEYSVSQILVVEAIFTFALVLVILNVATNSKTEGNSYYGLAIGFTIMAAAYAGGGISGGVYNPAVGTGPILIDAIMGDGGTLSNLWHYLVGPIAGAVLATYIYKLTTD